MKAKCLCESVRFDGQLVNDSIQACHCQQCQRWTGGGPLFVVRVKDMRIEGSENIATFHASEHGERGFCKNCGTTLYWTMRGKPPAFLPVGLLEDQSGLSVKEEIFVDHRPGWLPIFDGADQSTEANELANLAKFLESFE